MDFGLSLPIVQQVPGRAQPWEAGAGAAELLQVAQAADRLGFAWITCSDHAAVPASHLPSMGATWYEPATTLAYLAAATTRVRLLSHVLVLPYRHPLIVAKTYATLDHLSGGRVIIGTGSGHLKPEFRSLGLDHGQRGAMSDEYLRALATALSQEVSSFEGQFVRWRDMIVAPRPVQRPRPPIWVGGNNRAVARRAARYADGWIPWQLTPEKFAERVSYARGVRGGGDFALVAPITVSRTDSAAHLVDRIQTWRSAGATAYHVGFESHRLEELLDRLQWFRDEVMPAAR